MVVKGAQSGGWEEKADGYARSTFVRARTHHAVEACCEYWPYGPTCLSQSLCERAVLDLPAGMHECGIGHNAGAAHAGCATLSRRTRLSRSPMRPQGCGTACLLLRRNPLRKDGEVAYEGGVGESRGDEARDVERHRRGL